MSVKQILWLVLTVFSASLYAQTNFSFTGSLIGKITDAETKQPLEFANLQLELNGIVKAQAQTDLEGEYLFKNLIPGIYTMHINYGTQKLRVDNIVIDSSIKKLEITLKTTNELSPVMCMSVQRKPNLIGSMKAGVDARNGNTPNIRGGRMDGTAYYIDGIRVQGGASNERYKKIEENTYQSVKQSPLSTFSIDVDKASYANVRRFITSGNLPPTDAVRIEEMINYFTYDVPNNASEHPFFINTEVADAPWDENKKLVNINLKSPEIDMSKAAINNLTFLIDVSGSMMSNDKLPLLVESMKLLVNNMRKQDKISIVVYAGAAGLVLKPTDGEHSEEILNALNRLQAGGSTAGGEGIELAYEIAQEQFKPEYNNRIILATDGDFNVGVSNVSDLTKLIEKKRESGIYLSVLGFGKGNYNDELMESLADKGNGNYNYIDNLLEGKKVLVNELGGTLYTVAKDVKIQIEFNPTYVKSYKLIGYENRMLNAEDFNNDKKDAGELGAGHCVTAIYEIITVEGSAEQSIDLLKYQRNILSEQALGNELMTIKVRYKKPSENVSTMFDVPVMNNNRELKMASPEMRFAMSVALFGLKLRGSKSVKKIGYTDIIAMSKATKGLDDEGYRAEFIKLVETAELLAKRD